MNKIIKRRLSRILSDADIIPGGQRDWDVTILNEDVYSRVFSQGSLAVGETYMQGWWDVPKLDELIAKIYTSRSHTRHTAVPIILARIYAMLVNQQTKKRSKKVGEQHYDIGNDLYERMLDKRMIYTCGYWENADNLDEAQEAKLDLVCRKLTLQPGMRVLDMGCGFGGAARYMAEKHGVEVLGVTISKEQAAYAQEYCKDLPIEIRCDDYRNVSGKFDRVVSIGLLEHVGYKNYAHFMDIVKRSMTEDGLCLVHFIGRTKTAPMMDPWFEKYVFPGGMLPSPEQIAASFNGKLVLEDWQNIGIHYDKTLMAWYDNFKTHWPDIKDDYPEDFYRMWEYYLLSCAGAFRARYHQVWQIVLSPGGVPGGYKAFR